MAEEIGVPASAGTDGQAAVPAAASDPAGMEPASGTEPGATSGSAPGVAEGSAPANHETKTYTQDEVDQLVKAARETPPEEDPKEKEYRDRMAALETRELEAGAKELMKQKEVPEAFLGFLMQKDMETTEKNVDAFKAAFDAEVKAKLDAALLGKTPPGSVGTVTNGDKSTADVFAAALRR